MLQSKQYAVSWHLFDFHIIYSLPDVVRKCLAGLLFLLEPEDTTASAAGTDRRVIRGEANNAHSITKVMFWIVAAILFSLAIGQLR